MIIFKDVITGDELMSDAYDLKLVDDVAYEVDCKMITIKKGADVDIGANASAEGGEEELEEGAEIVNNIVYSFRLTQVSFDKKSYRASLKGYFKSVKEHLKATGAEEEIPKFEAGMTNYMRGVFGKDKEGKELFSNWEIFVGESMNMAAEGMLPLLNYRKDGVTPYIVFWKHGLKEEKV